MLPIQITIKDVAHSPQLESDIRAKAEKLTRFYKRICSCRVVAGLMQKNKHQGKLYNVRIDVTVPGKEFATTHKRNQDPYVAVRDAFIAMERQLEEHSHKRHGRVKTHHDVMHGQVVRIVLDEGYGFIDGTDGNEYYFSITNVSHPQFQQLSIGDTVEFIAVAYSDGRQAHRVVRNKHHNGHGSV